MRERGGAGRCCSQAQAQGREKEGEGERRHRHTEADNGSREKQSAGEGTQRAGYDAQSDPTSASLAGPLAGGSSRLQFALLTVR